MSEQDCLRRFIFEELSIRGVWVRLQDSLQQSKQFQTLVNDQVDSQLGQALAGVVLLSSIIKFEGAMILQAQGRGGLKALVAQATHARKIRGLVRSAEQVEGETLMQMMGQGHLVITVESDISEPYQGVVPLEQANLAGVLETYFAQSEQLATRLWLFANKTHAAGLMIQELPDSKGDQSDWERIETLASTVTANEMLTLNSDKMLYRLFNQEKVRLYESEPVEFYCNCSREKISSTLKTLGRDELTDMLQQQGMIEVDCQFCGTQYRFDAVDVDALSNTTVSVVNSDTRH